MKNTSVTLKDISETGKADICLSIDNSLPNEAYTLEVSSDRINISSNETAAGFFMVSSLCCSSCRQPFMMVTGNTKERLGFLLSALRMLPFPHRGAMMDVGVISAKEEVLKFLDLMAFYKLNNSIFI